MNPMVSYHHSHTTGDFIPGHPIISYQRYTPDFIPPLPLWVPYYCHTPVGFIPGHPVVSYQGHNTVSFTRHLMVSHQCHNTMGFIPSPHHRAQGTPWFHTSATPVPWVPMIWADQTARQDRRHQVSALLMAPHCARPSAKCHVLALDK